MYLLLLLSLLCTHAEDVLKLGIGQAWYDQEKATPQSLEGILDYQAGSGRVGVPANYAPFRFVRKDAATGKVHQLSLHAPGFESLLALNVGQRVLIDGKIVTRGEGEQKREEFWVGKLQALGPAPMNVFTELKVIARSNRFQPNAIPVTGEVGKVVIRSAKEATKALGHLSGSVDDERIASDHLTQLFGIKAIDWKTQMVIYVGNAYQRQNLPNIKKIEITKLDVHERGVTVYWKSEEGRATGSPYVTDTVLVPRVDGEITFKQEGKKPEDENKKATPASEKLIPQAPLK